MKFFTKSVSFFRASKVGQDVVLRGQVGVIHQELDDYSVVVAFLDDDTGEIILVKAAKGEITRI